MKPKRITGKLLGLAAAGVWLSLKANSHGNGVLPEDKALNAALPLFETSAGLGRLVPDLVVQPLAGKPFALSSLKSSPAVVIAFESTSCPVSKRVTPTLAALEKSYTAKGVKFIFVDPLETDSEADIQKAVKTHGLAGPFTRDQDGGIRAALKTRTTTEVFVLDAARTLVFRGAVDDQNGLGFAKDAPDHRYLAEALDSVVGGHSPAVPQTSAPGCSMESVTSKAPPTALTYHNRISRITQSHCLECHHEGGVAPFALGTYQEVSSHAGMIRKVLERGIMPPWFAAPPHSGEVSPWANDRSLSDEEKQDFLAWLSNGKLEGNNQDAPLPRTYPKDWEIGTPDVVFQIPEALKVKATGKMPYQNVVVRTDIEEDRWVEALEVRPTNREVVHHVLVFVVPKERLEAAEANARRGRDNTDGDFLAVYVPGNNVLRFPPGMAKLLPAGSGLHFQIHYTPNGTATEDQTRVGLKFARQTPEHQVRVAAIINTGFHIPPGDSHYEVRAKLPVLLDAKLMAFMPHMHVRGQSYRFDVMYPDGTVKPLLDVPRYDFNWQLQYRLREPLSIPAGSQLLATAWYDNSTNNPANPDPTREVKWGPQTDEEMMLGYFEFYAEAQKPGEKLSLPQLITKDSGASLVFNGLDKNHDGKITPDESPSPKAFTDADENGDGVVTLEELRKYLRKRKQN